MALTKRDPEDSPLYKDCTNCGAELGMTKVADLFDNIEQKAGEEWKCSICGEIFSDVW